MSAATVYESVEEDAGFYYCVLQECVVETFSCVTLVLNC